MDSQENTDRGGKVERDDLFDLLERLIPKGALSSGGGPNEFSPQLVRIITAWPSLPQAAKDEIEAIATHSHD